MRHQCRECGWKESGSAGGSAPRHFSKRSSGVAESSRPRNESRSGEGSKAMAGALVATIEGYFALGAAVPDVIPMGSAAAMTKHVARGLVLAQPRKERS